MNWNDLKKSYALPVICVLVAVLALVTKTRFSLIDYIADRTVEKIEGKYSPYGPERPTPIRQAD